MPDSSRSDQQGRPEGRKWLSFGANLGDIVAGFGVLVGGLVWLTRLKTNVPIWLFVVALFLTGAGVAYFAVRGTRRIAARTLQHHDAGRGQATLSPASQAHSSAAFEVAYLLAMVDALQQVSDSRANGTVEHAVRDVRNQLFDRIRTGVARPRAAVKCTYLMPVSGEPLLRTAAGYHSGHKARVENASLRRDTHTLAGLAFTLGEPQYSPDTQRDNRVAKLHNEPEMRCLFCTPAFRIGNPPEPAGILCVSSTAEASFADSDRMFMRLCASIIAAMDLLTGEPPQV